MTNGEKALREKLNEYLHFNINGKEVPIPYIMEPSRWNFSHSVGKGSPEMIYKEVFSIAEYEGIEINDLSEGELYQLMKKYRIGIDCSGFVYHLLDAYIQAEKRHPLSFYLIRYAGLLGFLEKNLLKFQRYRRINAATLTSSLNSKIIADLNQLQIGDLIQMSVRKQVDHVLVITQVEKENDQIVEVEYAQSSGQNTQLRGPHLGIIRVINPNSGLEDQDWLEKDLSGVSYQKYYHPEKGDSIRRLKYI